MPLLVASTYNATRPISGRAPIFPFLTSAKWLPQTDELREATKVLKRTSRCKQNASLPSKYDMLAYQY